MESRQTRLKIKRRFPCTIRIQFYLNPSFGSRVIENLNFRWRWWSWRRKTINSFFVMESRQTRLKIMRGFPCTIRTQFDANPSVGSWVIENFNLRWRWWSRRRKMINSFFVMESRQTRLKIKRGSPCTIRNQFDANPSIGSWVRLLHPPDRQHRLPGWPGKPFRGLFSAHGVDWPPGYLTA